MCVAKLWREICLVNIRKYNSFALFVILSYNFITKKAYCVEGVVKIYIFLY